MLLSVQQYSQHDDELADANLDKVNKKSSHSVWKIISHTSISI